MLRNTAILTLGGKEESKTEEREENVKKSKSAGGGSVVTGILSRYGFFRRHFQTFPEVKRRARARPNPKKILWLSREDLRPKELIEKQQQHHHWICWKTNKSIIGCPHQQSPATNVNPLCPSSKRNETKRNQASFLSLSRSFSPNQSKSSPSFSITFPFRLSTTLINDTTSIHIHSPASIQIKAIMKNACLSVIAVALAATSAFAYPQYAPTCEEDIRAAILFREENMNKSARWESALKSWFGAGEECLHCADDPCGNHGYHGNWEGLECRGDWITDDGWSRWSGQKSAKGNCKKITNFHLPDRGLEGPFPEALKYFPNLAEIDMDSNNLIGELPEYFACMPNLIEIDLEENQFTGTIPPAWGNLQKLEEVEVDDNPQLHGCIPHGLPADEHGGKVSFSTDPKIGTSWGGTRINGRRCANAPMPDCSHTKIPEDAPMPRKANITLPHHPAQMTPEEAEEYFRSQLAADTEKRVFSNP